MANGDKLQAKAAEMRAIADQASEDYVSMRFELRSRHGYDGYGHKITDARYGSMAAAKEAVGDNQWYMQRAQTYSAEAAMYYTKAQAIMANIMYERSMMSH
jgi:hypothetical protein